MRFGNEETVGTVDARHEANVFKIGNYISNQVYRFQVAIEAAVSTASKGVQP